MTTIAEPTPELDERRRKLRYRSWHRGMLEVDLILGRFADMEIARLDDAELAEFESLMLADDVDLLKWITGETPVPGPFDTPLFGRILASRRLFEG